MVINYKNLHKYKYQSETYEGQQCSLNEMLITAQSYIVYCPTQLTCLEDFDFHIYHLCNTNLYKHQSEIYEKQYCSQIDMSIPAPLLQSLLLQDIYLKLIDMLFVRKSYSLQPHKTVVLCTRFILYTLHQEEKG